MSQIPKVGDFYRHFKYNPDSPDTLNYTYQIVGVAISSEDESLWVGYRPLYTPNHAKDSGADFVVRPLNMFIEENFEKNGQIIPQRFRKLQGDELVEVKKLVGSA